MPINNTEKFSHKRTVPLENKFSVSLSNEEIEILEKLANKFCTKNPQQTIRAIIHYLKNKYGIS